jgi:hypothetical protein
MCQFFFVIKIIHQTPEFPYDSRYMIRRNVLQGFTVHPLIYNKIKKYYLTLMVYPAYYTKKGGGITKYRTALPRVSCTAHDYPGAFSGNGLDAGCCSFPSI